MSSTKKWYDNKIIVIILLIFIFPVGIFALWKGSCFGKNWKIILTSILALLLIISFAQKNTPGANISKATPNKSTVENTIRSHGEFTANITAAEKGDKLEVNLFTDIPTPFECALSADTKYPNKDKLLIGTFNNPIITSKNSTIEIDLRDANGGRLPNGSYSVEFEFNPVLAAQSDNPKLKDFSQTVTCKTVVQLKNGLLTKEYVANRNDRRVEIYAKMKTGNQWSQSEYSSLCSNLVIVKTKSAPARVAYYSKDADIIFLVNTSDNTILSTQYGNTAADTW